VEESVIYHTKVKAICGRTGHVQSMDGQLHVNLTVPTQLGGPGGQGTNPEQLFAASYAACFLSAMHNIAKKRGMALHSTTSVEAAVHLVAGDEAPKLEVEITVFFKEKTCLHENDIIDEAHRLCPYSNALRNNVKVTVRYKFN